MIDTHLHILPGIDDGPETIEESVALSKALVQEGVHTAIATPHYNDMFPHRSAVEIRERVEELQQVLDRMGIPLRLLAGHEVLIKPGLVDDIQAGRLATLNGSRYLLLELWNNTWLPETERVIFELRAFGIVPVLAHVERYRAIQQNHARLAALLEQGVLAQITIGGLVGIMGNTACRAAEDLLKKELIQLIASDAHAVSRRSLRVIAGLQRAQELLGYLQVYKMIETYPSLILQNKAWSING